MVCEPVWVGLTLSIFQENFAFMLVSFLAHLSRLLLVCAVAAANVFVVNTTSDANDALPGDGLCTTSGGACSLRAAVQEANALAGDDTVVVPAGTYTLTIAQISVGQGTSINGAGPDVTIVEMPVGAGSIGRVFRTIGTVTIAGMTIRNGDATKYPVVNETACLTDGGGVVVDGGTLTLSNVVLTQNRGTYASAVCVTGALVMDRVRLLNNMSILPESGALKIGTQTSLSTATLDQVEFRLNSDPFGNTDFGLIARSGSQVQIARSVFDGQRAFLMEGSQLSLTNVTMENGNVFGSGTVSLTNSTLRGGTVSVPLQAVNTVLLGTCTGTVTSLGKNVITANCATGNATDLTTVPGDPKFGALAQNGGFTKSIALLAGNVAIDAANPASCPATDQRNTARPQDGNKDTVAVCDIGAFEVTGTDIFPVNSALDEADVNPGDGICSSASGACTLRAAIQEANAFPGLNTVTLPAGTFTLTGGSLPVTDTMTLTGAGAASSIIEMPSGSAAARRVFQTSATVSIGNVTIRNGNAVNSGSVNETICNSDGGAIQVASGSLTLTDAVLSGNRGTYGSALCVTGVATLERVRVVGNQTVLSDGGAVKLGTQANDATATLVDVEFRENMDSLANFDRALLIRGGGQVSVRRTLFQGQRVAMQDGPQVTMENVTMVDGNLLAAGTVSLNHVTMRGGLVLGTIQARNSVLLATCMNTVTSLGNNVTWSGCPTGNGSNLLTTQADATFGALEDQGGYTKTIPVFPGSVALDAANGAFCPATDQRGIARPQDGNADGSAVCDIGAYERRPSEVMLAKVTQTNPASPSNVNTPAVSGTAPPNVQVAVYVTANCSGTAVTTTAGADGRFQTQVQVLDNSTYTLSAKVLDAVEQPCTAGVSYVEDSAAPAAPNGLGTVPGSPAPASSITVRGSAEAGATVSLYRNGTCAGTAERTAVATGGIWSFAVTVTVNTTTTFSATARDAAGNLSGCSAALAYTHDSLAPAAPTQLVTNPPLSGTAVSITVSGAAEAGASVRVYSNGTCAGTPAATTTAPSQTWQVGFTVAAGSVTNFSASAVDAAGNVSPCSAAVTYTQVNGLSVSIGSVKLLEGSGVTTQFQFPVLLSVPVSQSVTVGYATKDGTALSTSDYKAVTGTITIPAGQTRGTISVFVTGDKTAEADENFSVGLTSTTLGTIGIGRGTGTIANDDLVGIGELGTPTATVRAGVPINYVYSWTVPPTSPDGTRASTWRDLTTMSLRVRDESRVVMELVWDQANNTFALMNSASGRLGPAFVAGSNNRIGNEDVTLLLAETTAKGGGPTSPVVTLTLRLEFRPHAEGSYIVEGAATDDFGQDQPWVELGRLTVGR